MLSGILLLGAAAGGIYCTTGPHVSKEEARRMGERLVEMCKANQDWDRAAKLIEQGANVNIANQCGVTPIFYATLYNDTNMVNKLIETGADVDAESLGVAALNEEIVNALIAAGAKE